MPASRRGVSPECIRRQRKAALACRVQLSIQHLGIAGDLAHREASRLVTNELKQFVVPCCVFEPVEVRADQRVDARVVLHDGEGAGVREHVAGNL